MVIKAATFNQGKFPTVAFVNLAKASLEVDLNKLVAALAKQLERDFVPIWGYPAKLRVTQKPEPEDWQVVFLDDADAADALGYHDITKDGQPVSKVFVKTTIQAGEKVSVTASHELLEMMIDPGAQMWAQNANGWFHAYEMCDAVEAEVYDIDGIAVCDFVYPSFFESWHAPHAVQFDHLERVTQPYQTLPKGYQIVSDGQSAREIFGSRRKMLHFRNAEDRTLHRSEYRKQTMPGRNVGPRPAGSVARSPHAALLHHAGNFLTALADMVDPLPGGGPFELGARRPGGRMVDPLPGSPFELGARRPRGHMVDPLPGGDPFEL
jgi:hypothetical protein